MVDMLRVRHEAGVPLTRRANKLVAGPARYYFGSWNRAVEAAGLRATTRQPWTPQRVIRVIRERYQQSLPLTNVCKVHPTLATAALRLFGNWDNAVAAAGLNPRSRWTKRRVIKAMQNRDYQGGLATTWKDDGVLYRAATNHFGCWGLALRAAGLPLTRRSWSQERVIIELRAWYRHRGNDGVTQADASLAAAARKYFGSLNHALAAADIEPPPRKWTRELVVEKLQDRVVCGLSPHVRCREDSSLYYAVKRYFGNSKDAVAAAGIGEMTR